MTRIDSEPPILSLIPADEDLPYARVYAVFLIGGAPCQLTVEVWHDHRFTANLVNPASGEVFPQISVEPLPAPGTRSLSETGR